MLMSLLHIVKANFGTLDIDAQLGKRYQFELFENFHRCAEVYKKEAKVIERMLEIKARLLELRANLKLYTYIDLKNEVTHELNNFKSDMRTLDELTMHYPLVTDFIGAIKASIEI